MSHAASARLAGVLGVPGGVHVLGDHERCVAPAQRFAGELDFFGAQRLAVGLGGVGAVRASPCRCGSCR